MRVAFVSSHAQPGGSERYLELLLDELGPPWIAEVIVLQAGWLVDRLHLAGHPVTVVPVGRRLDLLAGAVRLRRELRRVRPRVIHANGVKAALVAGLATIGSGVPVIWVKHDFSGGRWLTSVVAALCRQVVGVSAAVTAAVPGTLSARVHVVPNGTRPVSVDRDAARAELRERLGLDASAPVVLFLGRLSRVKGARLLVAALPRLRERVPRAHVVIAGERDIAEPEVADELPVQAAALGVQGAISFLPWQDDPARLVAGADVVAVPSGPHVPGGSPGEGFGLVAIEAMAIGTPVVAVAAGALPEVLGDAGRLVAPTAEALADGLADVLLDPALRQRFAAAGRRRVAEYFTLERMSARMQERYLEAAR
ncbi:glycosyltransferase family 4 protein [Solirubrobacter sp. CPCC 204708]|uniref:Glycosyltransferase family 4 protein n=1 Tax=Solirubrobacter deserti TaxID=2282478 RepID=A0ABT4RS21_9ACTN|nr:glycosyltransferase family 4 protein [Solirubrobacter deserti]MBE2318741.1 glycosyltransferase family 4 protein [Solirubrobacter deserti]MDA0141331.1 glycosyltransferase family 4 protein [Solirubrobacter deserti]